MGIVTHDVSEILSMPGLVYSKKGSPPRVLLVLMAPGALHPLGLLPLGIDLLVLGQEVCMQPRSRHPSMAMPLQPYMHALAARALAAQLGRHPPERQQHLRHSCRCGARPSPAG